MSAKLNRYYPFILASLITLYVIVSRWFIWLVIVALLCVLGMVRLHEIRSQKVVGFDRLIMRFGIGALVLGVLLVGLYFLWVSSMSF
jgi:hypothetical protein